MADPDNVDLLVLKQVTQLATSVRMLAGWVVFAIILSIVGGVILGVQYSQQQQKLEDILNGTDSSYCSGDAAYLDPAC